MAGTVYEFGPFRLDAPRGQVTRDGAPVDLSARQAAILGHLLAADGDVLTKDALIAAAWDVAVTDNSLEQAISQLRRVLGPDAGIATVPRRGYRMTVPVRRLVSRASDDALDALLAPHRAFLEGRAALEALDATRLDTARAAFESVLAAAPDQASAHLGLASACVMQFETTRALPAPDRAALALALTHAREACRLDPASGEAWATLGLALDRHGQHLDALAATRQAVTLERDNWRHTFRLSSLAWGEERLRAAHRTLTLLPGFPLAHWMVATVHVARQSLDLAAEALDAGLASAGAPPDAPAPSAFHPVALHWLRGLIHLAQDDHARAVISLEAETAGADSGHLYARESAANAWYARGALRHRQGRADDAAHAFDRALALVPEHPMALACRHRDARGPLAEAALLALDGHAAEAASAIDALLAGAAPGSILWFLPVDPLLAPWQAPGVWADALRRLRARAA